MPPWGLHDTEEEEEETLVKRHDVFKEAQGSGVAHSISVLIKNICFFF
jgi:hypothetical protein